MALHLLLLLCLFPLSTYANIIINFNHDQNGSHTFRASGNMTELIENADRGLFFITEDALRNGVEALAGSRPDRVFLRNSFGQFSNIFESHGWTQTTIVTTAEMFEFSPARTTQVTIDRKIFSNPLGVPAPKVVNMENELRRAATSSWLNVPSCSWTRQIVYNINYDGRCPIVVASLWGCDVTRDMSTRFANLMTQTIPPRQVLDVALRASAIQYDIGVLFMSRLQGHAVAHWHDGDRLHAYDIGSVLRFGGMPLMAYTYNVITIADTFHPQLTTSTY